VPLPPAGGAYKLTYWKHSSPNGWQYIEDTMTNDKTIGGTGIIIDEVRAYPEHATMTTFTYDPLKGMTSSTDANGNTTYFEYDAFSRLKLTRDSNGKIVNHYTYHYRQ
jgi:YD repeat-containing protein